MRRIETALMKTFRMTIDVQNPNTKPVGQMDAKHKAADDAEARVAKQAEFGYTE